MPPPAGLEPATFRLTAERAAIAPRRLRVNFASSFLFINNKKNKKSHFLSKVSAVSAVSKLE
jgi:hypothetical protein